MAQKLQFHILSTAAQMSGVGITVLTLFYYLGVSKESFADEALTSSIILFVTATILSYLAIRREGQSYRMERIADWLFITGLLCLLLTTLIMAFVIF